MTQRSSTRSGVFAVAVAIAVVASCSSPRTMTIVPSPTQLGTGTTTTFTMASGAPADWGLSDVPDHVARATHFPVRISANHRYLVDADGVPWRIQADSAWLMSSEATPEEVDEYLRTRSAQGFNAFYLMAMVHAGEYEDAKHAPNNRRGDPPLARPDEYSSAAASAASRRYWSWVDDIIIKAGRHGMAVILAYNYLGWQGGAQGWYALNAAQPSDQSLREWGRWLGRRFKDRANVIWLGLGDFVPPAGSQGARRAVAVAQGIRDAGATQLLVAEPAGPDGIPGEDPSFGSQVDVNSFYGYGPEGRGAVYQTADRAWRDTPTRPAWMQEGTYEYENNMGHFSGEPWDTRRARYWSVLAGGTAGDGFGNRDVWRWRNLPDALTTPGATYSHHAFAFFATMPWWLLEPSGTDAGFTGADLVPSGAGTYGALDYITAARTSDHRWLLAYVPVTEAGRRTFTVTLDGMASTVWARWFDPTTGGYRPASPSPLVPGGRHAFTTPGARADGTDDWLLVLDTEGPDPCGTMTPSGVYTAPPNTPSSVRCRVTATLESDPSVMTATTVTFSP